MNERNDSLAHTFAARSWGLAYEAGAHAFENDDTQCPYVRGSFGWEAWIKGWRDAAHRAVQLTALQILGPAEAGWPRA